MHLIAMLVSVEAPPLPSTPTGLVLIALVTDQTLSERASETERERGFYHTGVLFSSRHWLDEG